MSQPLARIAVVGISGFVGSHVAREALQSGLTVHGTLRNPVGPKARWLRNLGSRLTLFYGDVERPRSLQAAFAGCDGVVMSAGSEKQAPSTIDLMTAAARNTVTCAHRAGIERVVLTSSTGSTNPPGNEPPIKREDEHVSQPALQRARGKFSPAAKTWMEQVAFATGEQLGVRVATMNPSLIVGRSLGDEPSQATRFFRAILRGERFANGAPDGSMSMIHVQDLARLHLAALQNDAAHGRHFAVVQSWHWQDILEALAEVVPSYTAPTWPSDRPRSRPTRFDTTKRDALGVELRGIHAMLADLLQDT